MSEAPTVNAVVEYAGRLRGQAEQIMARDPYAKPPYPTTAAARMTCSRKKRQALEALPENATDEQREAAAANAPREAIGELHWQWAQFERRYREENEEGERRTKRHVRRQRHAARDREAARAEQSLGRRLDDALAQLSAIAAPRGTGFDAAGTTITGSREKNPMPIPPGDPAAKARSIAHDALDKVEDELESARRRRVEREADAA